jgi:hypothetical protein
MWKFLKYWTGVQLLMSMPFIAPLAAALHVVFNRQDGRLSAPLRAPKKEPRVLVTRTEPMKSTDWKRVYRRIVGQTPETKPKAAPERAPAPTEQRGPERVATPTFPTLGRAVAAEKGPKRSRRRGIQR